MQNKNIGLILIVKPVKDNDLYIKILSANDVIFSSIVYGGNSSKKRLIYQPGYFISYNYFQKNTNSISNLTGEIIIPFLSNVYNDKFKLSSILSITSILNISTYEGIKINDLFISVKKLIIFIINNKNWFIDYCEWILHFLKLLGYEIEYRNNNKNYFNLTSLIFENELNDNGILFPYDLFFKNSKIKYESVQSFFIIFETIFLKTHLNNFDNTMPLNYLNFKKIILKRLENKNI